MNAMNKVKIIQGDCRRILPTIPGESVNCCVTSPPYFGLRDYGVDGQIGLEATPEECVIELVNVFREVKRILKEDGTLFLNIGDSYFGSGRGTTGHNGIGNQTKRQGFSSSPVGVRNEVFCDTSDKEPVNYQVYGCLCVSLCGVCREVYQNDRSHNNGLLLPMLIASLSLPILERMGFVNGHFPTWDFYHLENHILTAIQGQENFPTHEYVQNLSFQGSMLGESFRQLLDWCLRRDSSSSCLLCGRTLIDNGQMYEHKLGEVSEKQHCNQDIALSSVEHQSHNQNINMACKYCASYKPQRTIKNKQSQTLKPKDLIGFPWMVAFALRNDGWFLRQDIIWHKTNPMPESVRDRCTKSHEYIFLLSKSRKYFYDYEAIREPVTGGAHMRKASDTGVGFGHGIDKKKRCRPRVKTPQGWDTSVGEGGHGAIHKSGRKQGVGPKSAPAGSGIKANESFQSAIVDLVDSRNKRSVWTMATQPYSGAHFATFPEKLIEPCILAGCPEGGTVLDPFGGSGTTGRVATMHRRNAILIELNPEYIKLQKKRTKGVPVRLF